jgi:hypothetical protein
MSTRRPVEQPVDATTIAATDATPALNITSFVALFIT